MYELIGIIHKIEILFLPLFPLKWQDPPPSYRMIIPLLNILNRYEKQFPWAGALLYSLQKDLYPPYHQDRLTMQISKDEMIWVRFILTVILIILAMALIGKPNLLSPWVKGSLFWGSSTLFIYGAMHLSASALWATWGFLFPVVGSLAIGVAPWALVFLASWGLIWQVYTLNVRKTWQWFDWLSTFPILFFWVGHVSKMIYIWPLWQGSLLSLGLWMSLWIVLTHLGHRPWISKTLQFFWPASLMMISLIGWVNPEWVGLSRWVLWFIGTLGLSLCMSIITSRISLWSFLYRWETIAVVFFTYGLSLLFSGNSSELTEGINTGLFQLFNSMEILWWIVGAGIIMSVRGLTLILLKWTHAFLHTWIFFLTLCFIPLFAYVIGWLSPLISGIGVWNAFGWWVLFTLCTTLLVWRHKETFLREWMFWGFFVVLLFRQYFFDIHSAIELYWTKPVVSITGFMTLAIWLLWLNFFTVGKYLRKLKEKTEGKGVIILLGALLWLMVALLWVSYVEQQFSIRGRMNYDLFRGFTVLGVPLILYHFIIRHFSKNEASTNFPWAWILILGIGLIQVTQGIEHSLVASMEGQSLDSMQHFFHQTLLKGIPLEKVVPVWVMHPIWVLLWRILRWFMVMVTLTWIIQHQGMNQRGSLSLVWIVCLTSLTVWTSEETWFFWPSMPLEWAVILRPWIQTTFLWDENSLKRYIIYLLAGFVWGLVLLKFMKWRKTSIIVN
jgi:hypothetical protein